MSSLLRPLVRAHGRAFAAEQAANPEMRAWLAPDGQAGVAYVEARRWPPGPLVRVAAGEPLAEPDRLVETARAFEADANAEGRGVVWFGVGEALRDAMMRHPSGDGRASFVVGAEPVLDAHAWPATVAGKASLRAQIARARNKGVTVHALPPGAALGAYRPLLDAWLTTRGLPALHFLAQPNVLDAPGDRRFFVAERDGQSVAVLSVCPVAQRPAALIEWIFRHPEAPNGTGARLVDAAVRDQAARGTAEVSLGLVPLSGRAPRSQIAPSPAVRLLLRWTRAHARRFYHFDGLERFKAKFEPARWEPAFLVTTQPHVTLGTFHAVADAFAGPRSPERLVARALADAVRDEAAALANRALASRR